MNAGTMVERRIFKLRPRLPRWGYVASGPLLRDYAIVKVLVIWNDDPTGYAEDTDITLISTINGVCRAL